MKNLLKKFVKDEQGLELSEYAIMVALIILAILVAIEGLSGAITGAFDALTGKIEASTPAAG